jgi:hypothetical protein
MGFFAEMMKAGALKLTYSTIQYSSDKTKTLVETAIYRVSKTQAY